MSESNVESQGAFGALMNSAIGKRNDEEGNEAPGKDTLAGYISDSVKTSPMAVKN